MSETRTEKEIIAEAYSDEAAKTWRAPVQRYPDTIPWPIHLEAYAAYVKRWSKQTALIDLKGRGCRGGFGSEELDLLIPGWRDRVSYIGRLEEHIAEMQATIDQMVGSEPVLYVSEQQLEQCIGTYLPTRAEAEGNFQLPLYRHPPHMVVTDKMVEAMVKNLRDPFPSRALAREGGIDYWRDIMRSALRAAFSTEVEAVPGFDRWLAARNSTSEGSDNA